MAVDTARVLERELLRRMRLLDEHTEWDRSQALHQLRTDDPGEPLPTIVLVTTTPSPSAHALVTGLLGLGRRVGIVGVVLGPWPTLLTVDSGYQVIATSGTVADMRGATLATLSETDAAQLLEVIIAARGGPDRHAERKADGSTNEPGQPSQSSPPPAPPPHPAVYVRVFGVLRIDAGGVEVETGLERRGRQIIAYLATHDDPVLAETLDEAIFSDGEDRQALRHTIISRTRAHLRTHSGTTGQIIGLVNGHYRLNPAVVDTDVWQLHRLLSAARDASTEAQRREHLRALLPLVTGDPLSGCGYEWAEPVAERLRQQAVNALLMLAELTEPDDPDTALSALNTAIMLNPEGEPLYYKAIKIHINNDNTHSAVQLYRQLERRLAELDAEPEYSAEELIPRARAKSRNAAETIVR